MSTLASRIGDLIPEGNAKHNIRLKAFKLLFTTVGTKHVELGTASDKISATIGRLVFSHQSLGEREIEGYLLHYQPRAGDIIVNAGAYHGYFALYLSQKVGPAGQVICFEPEPNNLKVLRQNIDLNNARNITIIPKGLWSSTTTLPLISMGSGSVVSPNTTWRGQTTPVTTLDDELNHLNIKHVNLITMDIEGAEIEAVKGCAQTIQHNPNMNLAIASYHRISGIPTSGGVEKTLRSYGLNALTAFPRHLTTYGRRRNF